MNTKTDVDRLREDPESNLMFLINQAAIESSENDEAGFDATVDEIVKLFRESNKELRDAAQAVVDNAGPAGTFITTPKAYVDQELIVSLSAVLKERDAT